MRCILCHHYALSLICRKCQKLFLKPTPGIRILEDDFKVYSFYNYEDIADLIKTKHTHIGSTVYRIVAQNASKWFNANFHFEEDIGMIPIDDDPKSGYAHTAVIAGALKQKHLHPCYGALRAQNDVTYSAKSLAYRQSHPRGFRYRDVTYEKVILVDDLVTTGTTLLEAKKVLQKEGLQPLFALTLADAARSG
jgi:competence protein ComFC